MDNGAKIYNLDCRREDIQRNCNQTVKLQCMDSRLTQFCTIRRRFDLQCEETGEHKRRTMQEKNDGKSRKTPTILRTMQFQTAKKICEDAIRHVLSQPLAIAHVLQCCTSTRLTCCCSHCSHCNHSFTLSLFLSFFLSLSLSLSFCLSSVFHASHHGPSNETEAMKLRSTL